ncbi:MAG TPA: DNA polymerase III subunit delta, partial [Candidatus Omnitrophica bacterium]|nr:DNA polymerase III subunit delta [Candidatus Omnitrophota bacterium]
IKEKCREENKQIDNEAISLLIENTGRELSVTSQELGKLIIYVGENQQIEARDVEKVGIHTRSYTVFQLVDMISQKRTKNSINILRQLLTSGVTPQQIIGLLSWQFARLWKVKSLVSRGMAPYRALREVNIPSFSAKNFLLQVKNFSWEDLTKCFNLLLEADIQIKTGAEPNLTLELLILSFFK